MLSAEVYFIVVLQDPEAASRRHGSANCLGSIRDCDMFSEIAATTDYDSPLLDARKQSALQE